MKRQFGFVLIIPLIFTFCSSGRTVAVEEELAEVQQPVEDGFQLSAALFDSYVDVQEALAVDSYEDAHNALEQLTYDSSGELQILVQTAMVAEDIEGIRSTFALISDRVAKSTLPEGYSLAFCPMANNFQGANWVQKGELIANPYFGAAMSTCGEIIKQ